MMSGLLEAEGDVWGKGDSSRFAASPVSKNVSIT